MSTTTASSIIENFYRQGLYQRKQTLSTTEEDIKGEFKTRLNNEESNYHLFEQQKVVVQSRRVPIYQVDQEGLKEYLHDLGLLPLVSHFPVKKTTAEVKEQIKDFALIVPQVSLSPNKAGQVSKEHTDFSNFEMPNLAEHFYTVSTQVKSLKTQYEQIKKEMAKCDILKSQGKVQHAFGSLSYKEKIDSYDIMAILEELGMEFLLENSHVDFQKLNDLAFQGRISKREINSFRTILDFRVDSIIQTLDSVEKMQQHLIDRREYLRNSY